MYDVIIIGMGISGISAGIYAKQAGLNLMMFEGSAPGGILNSIDKVKNFAGIKSISGPDFAMSLYEQVNELEIPYKLEKVISVTNEEDIKIVKTISGEFKTKNVIIATGRCPRLLGLENESSMLGKGISTCALCDGNFYKGKEIAVVGAGNSALQESLYLANVVEKVYILMRRKVFAGSPEIVEKVKATKNIEILFETTVEKLIIKEDKLEGLLLNSGSALDVSGLFIYAGYEPDTKFLSNYDITNVAGYIEVDENLETREKNIFAIGDVTKKDIYQLMTAAADGARVVGKLSK